MKICLEMTLFLLDIEEAAEIFLFLLILFRETAHTGTVGEGQRERERILSRLHAPCGAQPGA